MPSDFRQEFPFFENIKLDSTPPTTVYLDSAATSQRINCAMTASENYYRQYNANVHRGAYELAQKATKVYEQARSNIAEFIGSNDSSTLVFTSGATEALNLIANGLTQNMLNGKQIVVCESEHHANLLPWQVLAKRFNLKLTRIPLAENGQFGEEQLQYAKSLITEDVALLAIAHASNALGNIYPVETLCHLAKSANAISVIDGTQAAAHLDINVTNINCDFYVLSGHKMYAGTGVGVLYGRFALLRLLTPSKVGGEMISHASFDNFEAQEPPLKFEAGTPNIAGVLSMTEAASFCRANLKAIQSHENALVNYLYSQLSSFKHMQIYGNEQNSLPIVAFNLLPFHCNDLASYLATEGIAVRAGHHCCMPLMQTLKIEGCVRVSIACYNTFQDVDDFIAALRRFVEYMTVSDKENLSTQTTTSTGSDLHISTEAHTSCSDTEKQLLAIDNWNEKHRQLLLISRHLPILPPQARTEINKVSGCESSVWLASYKGPANNYRFLAYSNSKIIRGLLFVILDKINTLNTQTIAEFDIEMYLTYLGLFKFFSKGRRDGIRQVIRRIQEEV
ncbi:aminotransferase class V-fold PLP-dependent enzyme [Glaciecola petra]|uniref:cysteine desulfurase n=1 Tax=Glaciecola petra TaxID=3075602 RepID=A0ABU2ZQ38_9ALTE|nr:aminotransferase class V-fold PLP-dependent enzyme [Aestuariibacter sp. P117]MDT0594173.1 aminotransferase class V-fold PLP-dependent enzyme [Aestuariibacter sp. P117]